MDTWRAGQTPVQRIGPLLLAAAVGLFGALFLSWAYGPGPAWVQSLDERSSLTGTALFVAGVAALALGGAWLAGEGARAVRLVRADRQRQLRPAAGRRPPPVPGGRGGEGREPVVATESARG